MHRIISLARGRICRFAFLLPGEDNHRRGIVENPFADAAQALNSKASKSRRQG
ncbi:hypothetical protein M3484_21915 [Pseudomonas sp. GX19020]|uniref:hypothetical protein n=1 Tax=Pseudomonas sp. GX19020 TaxID=2942277 RepID=UPI0020186260|nr:hypothetical protein [Pseudomonas sp. GX19020]MCL4069219.1 hypothetical protein [Pseudomonas sp. GX19020]